MKYFTASVSFLLPLIGAAAPLGLAPLLMFAAVVHIVQRRWREGNWPGFGGPVSLVLLVFALWSAVTLAWTIDAENAALKLARLLALIILGLAYISCVRTNANERVVSIALLTGLAIAICLVFIEKFAGAPLYRTFVGDLPTDNWNEFLNRFNRGMTVICLLAWPAARAAAKFHAFAGVALMLAALGLSAYMNSAAALLALVLGSIGYALVWVVQGRQIVALLGGLTAIAIFFMPVAVERIPIGTKIPVIDTTLPKSAYHRLLIWDFTAKRITERPTRGWGFYSSRAIPGGVEFANGKLPSLPLHPHNAALQWRLELGLPGVVLGGVLLFLFFRAAGKYANRADRATATAAVITNVTIALLSYGIWQSWWVAALIFSAASMPAFSGTGVKSGPGAEN